MEMIAVNFENLIFMFICINNLRLDPHWALVDLNNENFPTPK
jgi:hypothetical protein